MRTLALLLLVSCPKSPDTEDTAPVADPPRLTTSAQGIFDLHGRQILLRGANFPTVDNTQQDYDTLTGWGGNVVRQLFMWSHLEPSEGAYDQDYLAKLDAQVALAEANGVQLLIDHHQHAYGEGFTWGMPYWTCDEANYALCEDDPGNYLCAGIQNCFEAFWTSDPLRQQYIDMMVLLAERYSGSDAILGYDLMNEPFCMHEDLEGCGAVMGEFWTELATAIHAVDPDALIFWEPNFLELIGISTRTSGLEFSGGVYGAHYYQMTVHNGADYDGDPSEIIDNIGMRAEEAAAFDHAFFLGEFGGPADVAGFDQYIDDHMDLLDDLGAGGTYWLYARGDGFHMLDDHGNEKPFLDVFVRPFPHATPGVISALAYDMDSRVFSLDFDTQAAVSEPGVIFVPDRHYPDGFDLSGCDEPACRWEYQAESQRVLFHADEAGSFALRLEPPQG